jgi:citrate synthase
LAALTGGLHGEALERLVQLYDELGRKETADEWRMKLQAERASRKGPRAASDN